MRRGTRWGAIAAGAALAVPLTLVSPAAEAVEDGRRPAVRLLLDLTTAEGTATGRDHALRYTVRVRAEDGVAHGTTLHLTADRPFSWTRHDPGCTRSASGDRLRCAVGDVGERPAARTATLRIPSSAMSTPSAQPLSVVATADASNAPRRMVRAVFAFSSTTPTPTKTPT
ncbi:hypothetical protein, partial [Actinomadura bangladeshensis]